MMRVKVNGVQVFPDGEQLPAVTRSLQDLLDPGDIKGDRSTTIRILNTPELQQAIGTEAMNEAPASRPTVTIDQGGDPMFTSEAVVVRHTRDRAELVGLDGNAKWFEFAKKNRMSDFDFGQSVPLSVDSIMGLWEDTTNPITFPLADYGRLEGRAYTYNVQHWWLRPAVRMSIALNTMMASAGYRFEPKGRARRWWDKVLLLQPGEIATAHFYGHPSGMTVVPASSSGYTLTDYGSTPNALNLASDVLDPVGQLSGSSFACANVYGTHDVRVDGLGVVFDPFSLPSDGDVFYLVLWDSTDGALVASKSLIYSTGDESARWWTTFEGVTLQDGHSYFLAVQRPSGGFSGTCDNDLNAIVTFEPVDPFWSRKYLLWTDEDFTTYTLDGKDIPIQLSSAMPKMSAMDVINAISGIKALVIDTQPGGVIHVWEDTDHFKRAGEVSSYDWRDRADHTGAPAKVYDAIPSVITYRFKQDKDDRDLYRADQEVGSPGYGNAEVNLQGYAKPEEVTMPFSATVMGSMFGGNVWAPLMRDGRTDYQEDNFSREPRILIDGGLVAGTWTFGSVERSEYPYAYFVDDDDAGFALHFGNAPAGYASVIASDHARRINRLRSRILEIDLFLHDDEVRSFDFSRPVLVNDGYTDGVYYVQEIRNHRYGSGDPTRVVLVQADTSLVTYGASVVTPTGGDFNNDFNDDFNNV